MQSSAVSEAKEGATKVPEFAVASIRSNLNARRMWLVFTSNGYSVPGVCSFKRHTESMRIGHTRRLRRIKAYFTSAPWQSTP